MRQRSHMRYKRAFFSPSLLSGDEEKAARDRRGTLLIHHLASMEPVSMSAFGRDEVAPKFRSSLDPWEDTAIGIFMLVVGFVSVVGNAVAVQVFRTKGQCGTLVPELFLLNISVVNLLLAVTTYPAAMISAFYHQWIFGEAGCQLYGAVAYFLGLATILSLSELAVFRCIKTCCPHRGFWITARNTRICIGLTYVYSAIWALLPFLGWGGYDVEPYGLSCTLEWGYFDHKSRAHVLAVALFCLLLPFLTITLSHIAILIRIKQAGDMFQNRETGRQSVRAEVQCYRVSLAVCAGFIVAWFPYAIFCLSIAYGDPSFIPIWLTPLPVVLAKSSIAYNPLIYVAMTERYRTAFVEILRSWMCCCRLPRATAPLPTSTRVQGTTIPEYLLTVDNRAIDPTVQVDEPINEKHPEEVLIKPA